MMNNKILRAYLILITVPMLFACQGSVKTKDKANASASSVPIKNSADESYGIATKESVVAWKGSMLMGSNNHTGYVYISKGELMISNSQLVGGTVEVDMNTIEDETHKKNNGLIEHLKSSDFFDVRKFPIATITITKVEPINGGDKKITGNLTIKDITKPITFSAHIEIKDGIVKANGKLVINRTQWDIRYKSGIFYGNLANGTISDSIEFQIKIIAKK